MKKEIKLSTTHQAETEMKTSAQLFAHRCGDISQIINDRIDGNLFASKNATWGDAADLGRARELIVQAAVAMGAMSEEEALERYGVEL